LQSTHPDKLWTDYTVTSAVSGKTYRLALRGWERGESFCSCPDFRKSTLGTCKHILNALNKLKRRFKGTERHQPYTQENIAVHLLSAWDGPFWPTIWASAKRSRASVWPSFWRGKRTFEKSWSFVRPRSSRNGGMKCNDFRTAIASSRLAA